MQRKHKSYERIGKVKFEAKIIKKAPKFIIVNFLTLKQSAGVDRQTKSDNNKNIAMTSTSNEHDIDKIELKTEIITIEDEIPFIDGSNIEDLQVLEDSSEIQKNLNGGICYFFEPQTSKNTANNNSNDQKSELNQLKKLYRGQL